MGQENPKYHVSDDGKVFIVNDDGTTTEYGRVVPEKGKKSVRASQSPASFGGLWQSFS